MQLEGELQQERGQLTSTYKGRYYKGIIRGMFTIARDEGFRGLYKGYCIIEDLHECKKLSGSYLVFETWSFLNIFNLVIKQTKNYYMLLLHKTQVPVHGYPQL